MKQIRTLLAAVLLFSVTTVSAQKEKNISPMKEGTVLNSDDIGFLSMVSNADLSAARGKGPNTVTVCNNEFKAGQKLTAADEKCLSAAITEFQKSYKAPDKPRAGGWCYYWYYYCDVYGRCYYYKYWYWC